MSGIVTFILGVIALVGGFWLYAEVGFSVMAMIAALLMALGTALVISAIALAFNKLSPTSRKLGR